MNDSQDIRRPRMRLRRVCGWAQCVAPLLMFLAVGGSAGSAGVVRIDGADIEGVLYRLGDAAGPRVGPEGVTHRPELPAGRLRVRAFCRYNGKGEAYRMTPFILTAGGASRSLSVDTLAAGTPFTLDFVHPGGPLDITVGEGRLYAEAQEERRLLEARAALAEQPRPGAAAVHALGAAPADAPNDDDALLAELGLEDAVDPIDAAAEPVPVVLLERLEVERVSGPILVRQVTSDRITYAPGDTAHITVHLENLSTRAVEGVLTLDMTSALAESARILEQVVRLAPGETADRSLDAPLGADLWGRGFEARIVTDTGADRGVHAVSVVTNAFMAAFFGRGLPMHGSETWSPEQAEIEAERIARANMTAYCNAYEAFSWAPCSFSQLTVGHDEPFWSGQTQYVRRRSTLQTLHRVFERFGIGSITYGIYCAAGLPGIEHAFRYPDRMHVFKPAGFAHEAINVDILDRMLENRYRRHAYDEDEWAFWISAWTLRDSNLALIDFAADEVARSAAMFNWHGVRWDAGWATAHGNPPMTARAVHYAEQRLDAQTPPGFLHGYNISKMPRHSTPEGAFSDIELAAAARGGGLIMTEHYRGLQGRAGSAHGVGAGPSIAHLQAIGDATRFHGGYLLAIYDEGSVWNAALVLAGGARPMGNSLPFNRFATRFSAFILDPAMRRLANPSAVLRPVAESDFHWDAFVYEKPLDATRTALVLQLVNVTDELIFYAAGHRVPTGVSAPRRNVVFDLDLQQGMRPVAVHAFDAQGDFTPQATTLDGTRFTIPEVTVWTMAVVELEHDAGAETLAERCAVPFDLRHVPPHPDPVRFRAALDAAVAEAGWEGIMVTSDVLEAVLDEGPPVDVDPASRAYDPVDFADHKGPVDANWLGGGRQNPIVPRRNGRPDVLLVRGVLAHRARVEEALIDLPAVAIHDAYLQHGRAACDAVLAQNNRPCLSGWPDRERLAEMDVVILIDIPATAFSLEQRADLEAYVRGGGAVLAMGGWYSLSKGSWEGSLLEEFLPVRTVQSTYLLRLRNEDRGMLFEAAFGELLGEPPAGLADSDALEWMNHAQARDGTRVLMSAGGQPLLVYGRHGAGRTLAWTGSHSGRPEAPYWENDAWPRLLGRLLQFLAAGADTISPPDPGLEERLERAATALDAAAFDAMAELDRTPTPFDAAVEEHLSFMLRHGDPAAAFKAAEFLLEWASRLELARYPEWAGSIVPRIRPTEEWAALAAAHRESPPHLLGDLVAEIAAVTNPNLTAAEVLNRRIRDPLTRLRALAAAADPRGLPYLEAQLRQIRDREAQWDKLTAAGDYSSATVNNLYETRLLRPFIAYAMIRCGRRDADSLYEFCRGVLELPFYLWRQQWILETDRKRLVDAQRAMNPDAIAGARQRLRETRDAIRRLSEAVDQVTLWFTPETVGLEAEAIEAALRALREADSRKSLPLAMAYLNALPAEARPAFQSLAETAELPELRRLALEYLKES